MFVRPFLVNRTHKVPNRCSIVRFSRIGHARWDGHSAKRAPTYRAGCGWLRQSYEAFCVAYCDWCGRNHPRRRGWHVVFAGGVCLGAVAGERRAGHGMHVGWRDGRSRFADTGRNHAWRFPPSPPVCAGFYTNEDKSRASVVLAIGVAIGAVLILAGVCVRVFCDEFVADGDAGWPDSVLLACVAAAVFCFIMSGMTHDKVNVDKYNREAEEESAREGRSVPHPTMSESDRFYRRLTSAICGVIMLLATVIALLMLFLERRAVMLTRG